ncbi:hypothetical protein BHC59_00285 [Snodgrassella alvi]|nr:hypothetical protein BHC59_00285 [Snodgrassella alvi]
MQGFGAVICFALAQGVGSIGQVYQGGADFGEVAYFEVFAALVGAAVVGIIEDGDVFGDDVEVVGGDDVGYLLGVVFAGNDVDAAVEAAYLAAYLFDVVAAVLVFAAHVAGEFFGIRQLC